MKFSIINKSGEARAGVIETAHGKIETPNLAIVATHGKIRNLSKADHARAESDFVIANTFHLWVKNEVPGIKKKGGIHKWNGLKIPIMTDSGGFQVFSLGWGRIHGMGKVDTSSHLDNSGRVVPSAPGNTIPRLENPVKITDDGAEFVYVPPGGIKQKKYKLTPEKSMKIQGDIGADIIFAFDECTSPLNNYAYNKKSLIRTHRWAKESLENFQKIQKQRGKKKIYGQALFGIVQGGVYEDLRKKSSRAIGKLDFDGFGIGGSFGEKQMGEVVGWALSGLPDDKPRHLLGIGRVKDIFIGVEKGIDLFDCVIPTREGRHGRLYTKGGKVDIKKGIYADDNNAIEKGCGCFACANGISRAEIRKLFKSASSADKGKNLKEYYKGQRLGMLHNIYFYQNLFREIREAIKSSSSADKNKKSLSALKKEYKSYLSGKN